MESIFCISVAILCLYCPSTRCQLARQIQTSSAPELVVLKRESNFKEGIGNVEVGSLVLLVGAKMHT